MTTMLILPVLVGAGALAYTLAGLGGLTAAGASWWGYKKLKEHRHKKGMVDAFKEGGEAAVRLYFYEAMGVSCKEEADLLWEKAKPEIVKEAKEAASKEKGASEVAKEAA